MIILKIVLGIIVLEALAVLILGVVRGIGERRDNE
jgi:hypothetical protein